MPCRLAIILCTGYVHGSVTSAIPTLVCMSYLIFTDHSSSSSRHQTIFFHSSAYCFPTLLMSFVSHWVVMYFSKFKGRLHILCYWLCNVFVYYIGQMSLVMFPEGQSVIIVRRYHEINIHLYLIFGQYFG